MPQQAFELRKMVLAIALGTLVTNAHALTLGELHTSSFLGQALRASVSYRLAPGEEPPQASCLQISAAEDGLPFPSHPALRILEKTNHIEIISAEGVNEPIVGFILRSDCPGNSFARSYSLVLDLPPLSTQAESEGQTVANAEPPSAPLIKRKPWPRRVLAKENSNVGDLAAQYYDPGSKRYRKLVRALIAANPGLISEQSLVSQGTRLRTSIPPAPKPVRPPETPDRLTLLAEPAASHRSASIQTDEEYVKQLQNKIASMQSLQLKMETEISQLHQSLSNMKAATEASKTVAIPSATLSSVALAASDASKPVQTATDSVPLWGWLGGGFLLTASLGFWLGRRGQIASGYTPNRQAKAAIAPPAKPHFDISREPLSEVSLLPQQEQGIEVAEDENEVDRAQFLLAEGNIGEAIPLLYKAIEEDEKDIERWLLLFHVFREHMMRSEYAVLANRFKALPPDEEDWQLVSNLGRKIDPDNPLYIPHPKVKPDQPKADLPLEFLISAAAAHVPPPDMHLDLPPLESIDPAFGQKETPTDVGEIPMLPPEKPTDEDEDDFAKPCRY